MAHRKALLGPVIPQPAGLDPKSTNLLVTLPAGWNSLPLATSGEMKFRASPGASIPGQATLAIVAQSRPVPSYITSREERRMLAGVAVTDLRRIVIDKMITAGGWVTNDYQRDVSGYRIFVVTAQTPSDARSPEQSWNFYFTEINGRIYSLTTNTPRQFHDLMAAEAEKFIASLHATSPSSADTAPKR
jgi:hypothetical protein